MRCYHHCIMHCDRATSLMPLTNPKMAGSMEPTRELAGKVERTSQRLTKLSRSIIFFAVLGGFQCSMSTKYGLLLPRKLPIHYLKAVHTPHTHTHTHTLLKICRLAFRNRRNEQPQGQTGPFSSPLQMGSSATERDYLHHQGGSGSRRSSQTSITHSFR